MKLLATLGFLALCYAATRHCRKKGTLLHPHFPEEKGTYEWPTGAAWARWSIEMREGVQR